MFLYYAVHLIRLAQYPFRIFLNIQGTWGNVTYYFWYCSKITYLPEITSIIVSIAGCQPISYDSNKKRKKGHLVFK